MERKMSVHDDSASGTLDEIRRGGGNLVLTAYQRLAEAKLALESGHFAEAAIACQSLAEKVGQLAHAEGTLGRLADASIVRCGELREGMVVEDGGTITKVGPCEHCGKEDCENVAIEFESGAVVTLDCDVELVVRS